MRPALFAAAALLLAGCDQPLLSAQLEVPELRITTEPQAFDTTLPVDPTLACSFLPAPESDNCVLKQLTYDVGAEVPVLSEKGVTFDLRMTDVAFHLAAGPASSLAGVRKAKVEVRDPVTGSYVPLASYDAGTLSTTAAVKDVAIVGNSSQDMSPYLTAGKIDLRTDVFFDPSVLPTGFNARVEAGFSLVVTVDYGSYL
jgi:hypothetical protein